MASRELPGDVTVTGVDQKSLVSLVLNLMDVVNELQADHASFKTSVDSLVTLGTELKTDGSACFADLTELRAAFVALTAKMDTDFADVTNASVDYASTVDPAALTATAIAAAAPTAGPASLTESTAITNLRS